MEEADVSAIIACRRRLAAELLFGRAQTQCETTARRLSQGVLNLDDLL